MLPTGNNGNRPIFASSARIGRFFVQICALKIAEKRLKYLLASAENDLYSLGLIAF